MFFRVPGNGGSVLKIISVRSAHRALPAAGAQVSSDTSAEAIWAVAGQKSGDSGRAGTTPRSEWNFPTSQSRGYENEKHQRKQRSVLLSCFFRRVASCRGLSCTRELSHTKQKRTCHPLGPLQCHI